MSISATCRRFKTYAARDGAILGYRTYDGGAEQVVVLIHGSSDNGAGMHPLAKALRDAGASVYVPVLRGHGHSGRWRYRLCRSARGRSGRFRQGMKPASSQRQLIADRFFLGRRLRVARARLARREAVRSLHHDLAGHCRGRADHTARHRRLDLGGKPRIIALACSIVLASAGSMDFRSSPSQPRPNAPNLTSVYSFRLA